MHVAPSSPALRFVASVIARARGLVMRPVMRDALAAWLGQRALLLALMLASQAITAHLTPTSLFSIWSLWDGRHFADIARGGYQALPQAAFYPLFPLLERLLAPLLGGSVEVAGVVVVNAASLGAFVLLRALVERDMDRPVARRTLLYLAVFPTGMFLAAGYTESLFLLFSVAAFFALRERRLYLAGALAALATLTRGTGIALAPSLAIGAFSLYHAEWAGLPRRERLRTLAAGGFATAAPVAAYVGVGVALSRRFGVWDAPARAEALWGRSLDWPWAGPLRAIGMMIADWPSVAAMDLAFLLLWLGLACWMAYSLLRRGALRLPPAYIAYAWAALLLVLLVSVRTPGASPLVSISRYLLVVFPCFVALARWSARSHLLHYALLAASVCQLAALAWHFAQGKFVA